MYKLVVLDRDGVINEDSPLYIKSPEEWHACSGSIQAIAKLNNCGYKVVVATNQSGIARGYFTLDVLSGIHEKMMQQVTEGGGHIESIFICPHGPDDDCMCRKPKPGMLLQAAERFNVSPSDMVMIGDSMKDMRAAKNCGAASIFIKTEGKTKDLLAARKEGISVYGSLAEAVDSFCK